MEKKIVAAAIKKAAEILGSVGIENGDAEARILMEYSAGMSNKELLLNLSSELSTDVVEEYFQLVDRRSKRYPLQYIIGEQKFMGFKFEVSPEVLIPRRETEELVELVLKADLPRGAGIVDVGTGSGAIAVSLAKIRPDFDVYAIDYKDEIIKLAKKNAEKVGSMVNFLRGNLLEPLLKKGIQVDAIASNLPYVPSKDMESLMPEVTFEPREALEGGDDGLDPYRELLVQSRGVLKTRGEIFLEIDPKQPAKIENCLENAGYISIRIVKDLQGRHRFATAVLGG